MNRFEKWSVWLTGTATIVSGVGYFWTKYLLSTDDPFAVINHPLQPLFLKSHILVSPLLLFAIGLIATRHIWRHYRARIRWGRRSGIVAILTTGPMVLTGYLIQVLTHAGWLRAMAISHIAFGAVFAAGFVLHQIFVRPSRSAVQSGRAASGSRRYGEAKRGSGAESERDPEAGREAESGPGARDEIPVRDRETVAG